MPRASVTRSAAATAPATAARHAPGGPGDAEADRRVRRTQASILACVAAACFGLGVGFARLLSGEGGPAAAVAIPCDPPCPEGHECLQGICVAPPASMPAEASDGAAGATAASGAGPTGAPASASASAAVPVGDPVASVGMQRVSKCERPLAPGATCDHKAFPKMEYAMNGQAKRFTKCYLAARATAPALAGFLKVRIHIDFTNKRTDSWMDKTSNIDDAALRKCVLDAPAAVVDYEWPHLYEEIWVWYQISFGIRPK
ncbi:MAG TPA: hypothetical protein VG389_05975 [Myxococcota bacterium]|nr:hypothetical protein [Myxococcota bacterium]